MINPTLKPFIVSNEIIKPSSKSPNNHPTIHTLSFFDQISSHIYLPFVFFYPKPTCHTPTPITCLPATLSRYYPLAGRIKDNVSIECNDEGVEFLEARMECDLSEILKQPKDETVKLLFPDDLQFRDPILSSLLIVQVTIFDCGGKALAICISHKIMDIASMSYFIQNWAAIARDPDDETMCPEFFLGSLYPTIELPVMETYEPEKVKCVSRRIVFDSATIAKLKNMVSKEVPNPTRVEVVTALLYKSAISAARTTSQCLTTSVMHNGANLRGRVFPPLPENSAGNLSGTFPVLIEEKEESDIELASLARKIKKAKHEYWDSCGKVRGQELCSFVMEASVGLRLGHGKNQNVYLCSSFCRYPFYEADFGWGKPAWIALASVEVKNVIVLMDTREGDGIEAYVTLEEHDMAVFEKDEELLAFVRINPSALPESN